MEPGLWAAASGRHLYPAEELSFQKAQLRVGSEYYVHRGYEKNLLPFVRPQESLLEMLEEAA